MICGFLSRGDWLTTIEHEHQRNANAAKGDSRATDAGQETTTVSSIKDEIGRIDNELDDLDALMIEHERMSLRSRREQLRAKLSELAGRREDS